ncbi:FAD-dependent oxidoreductase [Actinoplanes sp. ATCC 53533]|uniref:flavin-containing monooxygenase n=1 Tax=Actinoplanes sp. ATCC 53533 TaxID=1288362 RepID=UPI000F7721CC|nr:NAD(P)-binding domain-containing protein [Actinoplanes sp. ATCC 53533]RSM47532.1 FAD-dependent oxidoreductase [Actinoplanes sp. ATCC 53533]
MSIADVAVIGGGQAGLATAHVARSRGLVPVVLDASAGPGGSWPHYYDSLTLFSPARFSSLPGLPFPVAPDRYPLRDEVVDYLTAYTARLDAEVRFGQRVARVTRSTGGFTVSTTLGTVVEARVVVAASGGFGAPYRPPLPGLDGFTGTVLHAADYREPMGFAGARVVVVGGGNSAVQIAVELAEVARVTVSARRPVRWQPQRYLGRDFHWWLARAGVDTAWWGPRLAGGTVPVIDDGRYRAAVRAGRPDRRPSFARLDGEVVVWADGTRERVDVLLLATGYRPDVGYLAGAGGLDATGAPLHRAGVSATVPGLGYVGLERQRSFASATLRGVGRDAAHVLSVLARDRAAHAAAAR